MTMGPKNLVCHGTNDYGIFPVLKSRRAPLNEMDIARMASLLGDRYLGYMSSLL